MKLFCWGGGVFVLAYLQGEPFLVWEKNELGRYECFPRGPVSSVVDHHVIRDDF